MKMSVNKKNESVPKLKISGLLGKGVCKQTLSTNKINAGSAEIPSTRVTENARSLLGAETAGNKQELLIKHPFSTNLTSS